MKKLTLTAAFALTASALFAACTPEASAPAAAEPAAASNSAGTGGSPCDPPMIVPASITASVRSQFEAPDQPRPAVPPEDMAAYQAMQTEQKTKDWAATCYYRAENAALLAEPAVADRVVFMGDSITQLWGLAEPQDFGPSRVNRGISGQTTPQMLIRFRRDVLALKPKAVHILAGVNDIAGNTGPTTLEDIENNISSMVELAKAHGVQVILATPLPAARFAWAPQLTPGPQVAQYAEWIRRYAAEQGLVLADYYPALATPEGAMKPELGPDGVHPNKAGYALMKPILDAAMAEALGR